MTVYVVLQYVETDMGLSVQVLGVSATMTFAEIAMAVATLHASPKTTFRIIPSPLWG